MIRRTSARLGLVQQELDRLDGDVSADGWLLVRARLGELLADYNDAVGEVDRLLGMPGAQVRIIRFLKLRLGEVVTKDELSGVAGIHEWARRVRELREDDGWSIHSMHSRESLGVGEYLLVTGNPDPELARTWAQARQMRKLRTLGGAATPKARTLEFLRKIYPRAADREQLSHVAGSIDAATSIISDLADDGWAITHCDADDPIAPGGTALASLQQRTK